MVISPFFSLLTLLLSISTQVTSLPVSAKQVPVTNPTYPVPTTVIFIIDYLFTNSRTLLVINCNCSSSNSVCIGNEITLPVSQSVTGIDCDAVLNCSNIFCLCPGTG